MRADSTVEGNKYQAVVEKIKEKVEVRIKFKGYVLMPTRTYLRPTEEKISVEYVAEYVEEPAGIPDNTILKAYNEEYDVLIYDEENSAEADDVLALYETIFKGNPIVKDVRVAVDQTGTKHGFVRFQPEVIQFFDDDIYDYEGNWTGLAQGLYRAEPP